jgi:hypothetical protein
LEYDFFKVGPYAMFVSDGPFKGKMLGTGSYEFLVHSPASMSLTFRASTASTAAVPADPAMIRIFFKKLNASEHQNSSWFSRIGPTALMAIFFILTRFVVGFFQGRQQQPIAMAQGGDSRGQQANKKSN